MEGAHVGRIIMLIPNNDDNHVVPDKRRVPFFQSTVAVHFHDMLFCIIQDLFNNSKVLESEHKGVNLGFEFW